MKVLRVSEDCLAFLADGSSHTGEIHSTFERAVNVLFNDGTLMTIVSDQMDLAPMTCQVSKSSLAASGWQPGMLVSTLPESIFIGAAQLDFTVSQRWPLERDRTELPAVPLSRAEMMRRMGAFTAVLLKRGRPEGLLPYLCEAEAAPHPGACPGDLAGNRYVSFIKGRLDQFAEAYRDGTEAGEARAAAAFSRLVGFGPGLTPSSDDFVAGFMAASLCTPFGQFMDRERLLRRNQKLALQAKGKTTVISEAMLAHAARGHVAQKYRQLLDLLCSNAKGNQENAAVETAALDAAVLEALNHGDTSGTDFLTGAAVALMLSLKP